MMKICIYRGDYMADYENLIDITAAKQREQSNRIDNALFFISQIKDHTKFRVDRDVVEIKFSDTKNTLSNAITSYLQQKNRL